MNNTVEQKLTEEDINRLVKLFSSTGFKNRYRAIAKFVIPFKRTINFELNIGGGSYTDGKRVVVGLPEELIPRPRAEQIMGLKALVGHECEHIVSSDFDVFKQFQEDVRDFFQKNYGLNSGARVGAHLLNAVEDGRIEKRLVNRLKGMKKYIQFLRGVMWESMPVQGEEQLGDYAWSVCIMATMGVWPRNFENVHAGTELEEELNRSKHFIIQAINEPTAQGCADRVMDMIKENADFIAESMKPRPEDQNQDQGQGEPGEEGESGEGQPGENNGQGNTVDPTDSLDRTDAEYTSTPPKQGQNDNPGNTESSHFASEEENAKEEEDQSKSSSKDSNDEESEEDEEGEGAGTGENEEDEDDSKGNEDSKDEDDQDGASSSGPKDDSDEAADGDDDNSEQPKSIEELIHDAIEEAVTELTQENQQAVNQSVRENTQEAKEQARQEKSRKQTELTKKEQQAIMNLPGGPDEFIRRSVNVVSEYEGFGGELKRKGFKFHKDLEKIFLNKKGFTRKNRRKGMLDSSALWRLNAGDTDVFIQKGQPQDSDFVVSVLVDNSGSMAGSADYRSGSRLSKAHYAKQACVVLEEGLNGIMPFQIAEFDAGWNEVRHDIIRGFEEESKRNLTWERMDEASTGNGNGDGYSIKIAHAELMKRPERKKVLFVLSDGEPSAYHSTDQAYKHVKEAVEEARRDGVIVVAIRFGEEEFLEKTAKTYKYMYGHSYIACKPADIQKELLKTLKKVVK